MNLPAHIITCYPPSMNLPAHGTTSPDPSKASSLIKNNTLRKQRTTTFPPGPAHTLPGETVPDRLTVLAHRQAPEPIQRHYLTATAWRSTSCHQAPPNTGTSTVFLPPGGYQQTARCHIRDTLLLIWHTTQLILQPRFSLWYLSHVLPISARYLNFTMISPSDSSFFN